MVLQRLSKIGPLAQALMTSNGVPERLVVLSKGILIYCRINDHLKWMGNRVRRWRGAGTRPPSHLRCCTSQGLVQRHLLNSIHSSRSSPVWNKPILHNLCNMISGRCLNHRLEAVRIAACNTLTSLLDFHEDDQWNRWAVTLQREGLLQEIVKMLRKWVLTMAVGRHQ